MAAALDKFFQKIPKYHRYHLELRTDLYLRDQIFEVMEKIGVGQILSHWTWLPPLRKQLAKAGGQVLQCRQTMHHQAPHAFRHALR